ncbi:NAD(P)/FAD-dependent oxidoreductase [Nocardioides sp.]|uniref:NAD(P)/FAD-dependent oxidoreductase n=1 Tax=Nocardioides sp. TaxID=35761 RepID=UPI0039E49E7A
MSIAIIGAGLAAASAVETLRDVGSEEPIAVVGTEPHPPYERPQLSKDMLQGKEFKLRHDEQWYADHAVDLRQGVTATAIDRDVRTVMLSDGGWLPYDRLLIATGASPRVPDLPGIEHALTLRTVEDARRLRESFEPGRRLVTIGGGWIGLEVAAAARQAGLRVTVLEQASLPLGHVLGEEMASYLVDLHTRHGVEIKTGARVTAVTTTGVSTNLGEFPADLVVAAIGAVPNTDLAEAAGLKVALPDVGAGVVVGDHLQTDDPAIFAAGDVALADHLTLGPLRIEHWDNAIRQGRLAARAMLGEHVHYDWAPYFFTDQFDFGMEYVGHASPDDDVVVRGDRDKGEFIAYWLRGRTLTAAMNVNIWDVNDRLRELVGTEVAPADLTDLR